MTTSLRCLDRRYCRVAIALVAVAVACAGCDSHPAAVDASAATAAAATPPPKATAEAATGSVAEGADPKLFTTTGPLVAQQQADIAAERNGRVVSINVRIGDRVQKGQ